jgi:thioredoxin-dependent peroxiredoxin
MAYRIIIGALIGGAIGGVAGHLRRCETGACPLTSSPVGGAIFGAILGALVVSAFQTPAGEKERSMEERPGLVTMKENSLTLLGNEVKVGDKAPDFVALDTDLSPVKFSSFHGKVCILASVPSLDTPVCDLETRRFNEEAGNLGEDVVFLTVSMDLPFAQKRWCEAAGVTRVKTLSDHRDASFGMAYGVLIKELRLLARAVFVVDREGMIRHAQLVRELTKEPDYGSVLKAVRGLM